IAACDRSEHTAPAPSNLMNTSIDSAAAGKILSVPYDSVGLAQFRAEKNQGFRRNGSPIPSSMREQFKGLSYYPPAPSLVFSVSLVKFPQPDAIEIAATKGDIRKMMRYGTFTFPVDGKLCRLTVYKAASE